MSKQGRGIAQSFAVRGGMNFQGEGDSLATGGLKSGGHDPF